MPQTRGLRITIITPTAASARTGNRHTAMRYAAFLRSAGHRARGAPFFSPGAEKRNLLRVVREAMRAAD